VATACVALGLAAGLGGCVSTQRKNARAELVADRTLAGRAPLRLHRPSRAVRVVRVALVRGARASAFVVTLRNRGAEPATDVPLAVGVRDAGGPRTEVDGGGGLGWFRTHVPSIGADANATWVFTARRPLPAGTPYAVAGAPGGAVVSRASGALPALDARVLPPHAPAAASGPHAHGAHATGRRNTARGTVTVLLVNRSAIPQYDVQVYAVARDGARVLAAGAVSIDHLASHGQARVRVALVGDPGRHTVRISAPPTIFE